MSQSMYRLSNESDSDVRTESIDWLELKHAVDKEQSLPLPCKLYHGQFHVRLLTIFYMISLLALDNC